MTVETQSQSNVSKAITKQRARAFSHKVRSGCLTCKARHKKCDERKPFCRRCEDAKFKCDGYGPPKMTQTRPQKLLHTICPPNGGNLIQLTASPLAALLPTTSHSLNVTSRDYYFHHFRTETCGHLAEPPGDLNFWSSYVLPLAGYKQDGPVMRAVVAVGSAHRLFLTRHSEAPHANTAELDRQAIHLYNEAILSITTQQAELDPCTILICCLLFICFESMTGRYEESIKHFQAGMRVLASSSCPPTDTEQRRQIFDLFARVGVETSILMESPMMPSTPQIKDIATDVVVDDGRPFRDLIEASAELRKLDIQLSNALFSNLPDSAYQTVLTQITDHDPRPDSYMDSFEHWGRRFETTVNQQRAGSMSACDQQRLKRLLLAQQIWAVVLGTDMCNTLESFTLWSDLLDRIEGMAWPIVALNQPTFSLDGDIVSGLSLIVAKSNHPVLQQRGLSLLRSLNRREGMWDSCDIAEMHEATLQLEDSKYWYEAPVPGGLPGYVKLISSMASGITPNNGLLSMSGTIRVSQP